MLGVLSFSFTTTKIHNWIRTEKLPQVQASRLVCMFASVSLAITKKRKRHRTSFCFIRSHLCRGDSTGASVSAALSGLRK